mmetsp:Transcript_1266/g.2950  ORF Transcript_1266/g.2950 Transcript_1266/m.2950 type:complete len:408 (-) Transcript_1266:272-1495(-)
MNALQELGHVAPVGSAETCFRLAWCVLRIAEYLIKGDLVGHAHQGATPCGAADEPHDSQERSRGLCRSVELTGPSCLQDLLLELLLAAATYASWPQLSGQHRRGHARLRAAQVAPGAISRTPMGGGKVVRVAHHADHADGCGILVLEASRCGLHQVRQPQPDEKPGHSFVRAVKVASCSSGAAIVFMPPVDNEEVYIHTHACHTLKRCRERHGMPLDRIRHYLTQCGVPALLLNFGQEHVKMFAGHRNPNDRVEAWVLADDGASVRGDPKLCVTKHGKQIFGCFDLISESMLAIVQPRPTSLHCEDEPNPIQQIAKQNGLRVVREPTCINNARDKAHLQDNHTQPRHKSNTCHSQEEKIISQIDIAKHFKVFLGRRVKLKSGLCRMNGTNGWFDPTDWKAPEMHQHG